MNEQGDTHITMNDEDETQLRETVTLKVHAYDWVVHDRAGGLEGNDEHVAIHCWALDKDSKSHLLRFTNFPAFCYIELPLFVRNRPYNWRQADITVFMEMLAQRLKNNAPSKHVFKPDTKKTYYHRCNRKFPMIMVCFDNLESMRHCANLLSTPLKTDNWGFIKCNVWENDISIVRKLLTIREVHFSQWFNVQATLVDEDNRISSLEKEYVAEWDTMTPIHQDESKSWSTKPGILAFDIETYSNNHRAMPNKYDALHVAYMISAIYQRYKNPESRKRYCIIIGDCQDIPKEKLSHCEIIRVETEKELIDAFNTIIHETDPEIITGYNILGFDYPYLDHRLKRRLNDWPAMGRILGTPSYMTSKTWQSGAYGHQSINIVHMEGRISVDLLPIVRRDFKLDKYDLNTVCKHFIGKTKHDVKASEMFEIYESMQESLKAVSTINEELTSNPELVDSEEFQRRKLIVDDQLNKAKAETTKVVEYCIQDAELVIELMEKMNVWIGLVEMSNVVGTSIVDLFTRGQQVRCLSQLYDLASRSGYILDKRDTPGFKFSGGFVYEPIPGLYDNIICLDFSSLYPSIIMAYNICYTTLVPPELMEYVPDSDCNVIEFDQEEIENEQVKPANEDEGVDHDRPDGQDDPDDEEVLEEVGDKVANKKSGMVLKHYKFKWYKRQEGLLPKLVRQLVVERRAVNKQITNLKKELSALEKTEDLIDILRTYLDGTLNIMTVKEASDKVKQLTASFASANEITQAKYLLSVAQIFDLEFITEQFNKLSQDQTTNPETLKYTELTVEISQAHHAQNKNQMEEKFNLLNAEQAIRHERIETLNLTISVLHQRQLAIKVSANSFFGFLGVHTGGMMPLIEGAMSITAMGRRLIGQVRTYIEDKYGGVQVYGDTDSVRGDTPVLIKYPTGAINYIQIKDMIPLGKATGNQEYYDISGNNAEIWTEKGWTKMKYLMRHRTTKQLFRIVTHTGIVDVTEDHSLLNEYAQEIKPTQVNVGTKLLHYNLPNVQLENPDMDEEKAWAWGFFMAEGTCGTYNCPSCVKSSWSVSNQNHDFLNKAQRIMNRIEPNYKFVIDPCMKSSNVDKLNARGDNIGLLVEKYDALFYTNRHETMVQNVATTLGIRFKKVPYEILMATNNVKSAFLQGWYDGDGAKTEGNSRRFDIKGQIGAAGLFHICSSLGYNVSINTRVDKQEIYRITITTKKQRKDSDKIKKIIPLGVIEEDVFDIETENHHFSAGIGRIVVHNSVMMDLHIKDPKECDYWGKRLAMEISGIKPGEKDWDGNLCPDGKPGLFPPPLAMEFEKAMRLLCLRKKKYAAFLIGKDGNFKTEDIKDKQGNIIGSKKSMLKKGIVLARRDNCNYLRKTYTQILDLIMNRGELDEAIKLLVESIQNLLDGKIPVEDLAIVRGLGANYKSESYFMKVFSDELKKAGKNVNPGDRLDFVIVTNPSAKLLGHKMRLLEQYNDSQNSDQPEQIDYNYYIEKVLMNSINQLFEVGFKQIISRLPHFFYRPTNRHKPIFLDRPIQIILKMRERNYDINTFLTAVFANVQHLRNIDLGLVPPPKLNICPPISNSNSPPEISNSNKDESKQIINKPRKITLKINPPKTPTLTVPNVALKVIGYVAR